MRIPLIALFDRIGHTLRFVLTGLLCLSLCLISMQICALERGMTPQAEFELPDLDGRLHRAVDYRGQLLVLTFWASWCGPCREEMPSLNRAHALLSDDGVGMLAINFGEEASAVRAFTIEHPVDFRLLIDQRGSVSSHFQINALPTSLILDRNGSILKRVVGKRVWDSDESITEIRRLYTDPQPVGVRLTSQ